MNYKLRISLDIDGTIADFDSAYLKRFKKWPNYDWAITRNVNNILIHEREFWLGLPVLRRPNFVPKIYCTSRISSKRWTRKYLEDNQFPKAPVFQVPGYNSSKEKVLKGRCDVHIEDSINQFMRLNKSGIPCLLIDNDNNRFLGPILRIYSLDENEITDTYWLAKESGVFEDFDKIFVNEY